MFSGWAWLIQISASVAELSPDCKHLSNKSERHALDGLRAAAAIMVQTTNGRHVGRKCSQPPGDERGCWPTADSRQGTRDLSLEQKGHAFCPLHMRWEGGPWGLDETAAPTNTFISSWRAVEQRDYLSVTWRLVTSQTSLVYGTTLFYGNLLCNCRKWTCIYIIILYFVEGCIA